MRRRRANRMMPKARRHHVSILTSPGYFSLGSRPPSLPRPASKRAVRRVSEIMIGRICKVKHQKSGQCLRLAAGERLIGRSPPLHSISTTSLAPEQDSDYMIGRFSQRRSEELSLAANKVRFSFQKRNNPQPTLCEASKRR